MDVNEELKLLWKCKKIGEGRGWGGGSGPAGDGGSRGWGWSRGLVGSNVGVGGDVGYGGCEPRIEGIVQCTNRYFTILRKF